MSMFQYFPTNCVLSLAVCGALDAHGFAQRKAMYRQLPGCFQRGQVA